MKHQMAPPIAVDEKVFELLKAQSEPTLRQDERVAAKEYSSPHVEPGHFVAAKVMQAAASGSVWQTPFVAPKWTH